MVGRFFERLVRSFKRCLKKTLRTARVTYEELSTILIEVEGALNSRPWKKYLGCEVIKVSNFLEEFEILSSW